MWSDPKPLAQSAKYVTTFHKSRLLVRLPHSKTKGVMRHCRVCAQVKMRGLTSTRSRCGVRANWVTSVYKEDAWEKCSVVETSLSVL